MIESSAPDGRWIGPDGRWTKTAYRRATVQGRLLDAEVATACALYTANRSLECAVCEESIDAGELFSRAFAPGCGRSHVNLCRGCRRFQVVMADL